MAYNHEYPYTDSSIGNMDWILTQLREYEARLDGLYEQIITESKQYIDSQIASTISELRTDYNNFTAQVNRRLSENDKTIADFTSLINGKIALLDTQFANLVEYCESILGQANAYTQQSIANNNEYIIEQTQKALFGVRVLNYFTGEYISIQAMFDYLAQFHLENAITYTELAEKLITYEEYKDLNMTYTDLAIRGGTIIP